MPSYIRLGLEIIKSFIKPLLCRVHNQSNLLSSDVSNIDRCKYSLRVFLEQHSNDSLNSFYRGFGLALEHGQNITYIGELPSPI